MPSTHPILDREPKEIIERLVSSFADDRVDPSDIWRARAISLTVALVTALCHLRDKAGIALTVESLRENLDLAKLAELSERSDIPANAKDGLSAYLKSLPCYAFDPEHEAFHSNTVVQHGYLQETVKHALSALEPAPAP